MSEPRIETTVAASIYAVRRESRIRQYYLEQIDGPGVRERIPLEKDEVIVGRANNADIEVPSTWVSRHHARLVRRGTDYQIWDNESQNGIFLNGVKIHSAVLRDGDVLQAADCIFVYREA